MKILSKLSKLLKKNANFKSTTAWTAEDFTNFFKFTI